jgi:predicted nucleic acid-binding protein
MIGTVAVLDACVLFPASLRDTLLWAAQIDLYGARWSSLILDEVVKNLVGKKQTYQSSAEKLRSAIEATFPASIVPTDQILSLIPQLRNDPKDRHVLATAVVSQASTIVTFNLADFPESSVQPYGISVMTPDEFLTGLFHGDDQAVISVIQKQSAVLKHPPKSVNQVLDTLSQHAPQFAQLVQATIKNMP